MRSLHTATKSSPHSPQLEKARAQQRRPNAYKKKKKVMLHQENAARSTCVLSSRKCIPALFCSSYSFKAEITPSISSYKSRCVSKFEVSLESYLQPWFYFKLEFNVSYFLLKKMIHVLRKRGNWKKFFNKSVVLHFKK